MTQPAWGYDISTWQESPNIPGEIDFFKMRDSGASFVFIKSSQGTIIDNDFEKNWIGAKSAGLLCGPYHFADYRFIAEIQARYFHDLIRNESPDLPPVLDFELRDIWNTPTQAACTKWIQNFFTEWEKITTMPIIFYCNPSLIRYNLTKPLPEWLTKHDLWIAHYTTADRPTTYGWPWTFWQFTDRGDGIAAGVESKQIDMNYFNGTLPELMHYSVRTMGGIQQPQELTLEEKVDILWKEHEERMK